MRQDKLTTKFQEALGDAQSLALGNDNAYIEPPCWSVPASTCPA